MIVLIDNYDSFVFNLFHYLGGLGADVVVHRNDKVTAHQVIAMDPDAVVLSPGPCTPDDAGICLELIAKAAPTIPVLGVCLGHQAIGQAFGGDVVRADVAGPARTDVLAFGHAGDDGKRAALHYCRAGRLSGPAVRGLRRRRRLHDADG